MGQPATVLIEEYVDLMPDPMNTSEGALKITAFWDPDAGVWVAESEDVPGLVVEAESLDKLVPELNILIPELLAANNIPAKLTDHRLHYRLDASLSNAIDVHSAA